jgi:hypothetical protein
MHFLDLQQLDRWLNGCLCIWQEDSIVGTTTKLLTEHEHLMHLHTDDQLASFSTTELVEYYAKHNIQLPSDLSDDNLGSMLATHERTRTIMVWHDHSEILGHDSVLVTVKIV